MGLISDLARGMYNPQLNAAGINAQGQPIDKDGNVTTLYTQPGFFQKAFNPYADEIAQENLRAGAANLIANQGRAIQRGMTGKDVGTIPTGMLPFGTDTNANITAALNPWARPTELNPQVQGAAYAATGAPGLTGTFGGQADINTAQRMLASSQSALARTPAEQAAIDAETANRLGRATQVDPLEIQHEINQLRTQLGQDPTEAQILANINKIKAAQSGTAVQNIPLTTGAQTNEDIKNYIMSSRMQPPPFVTDRVNPEDYSVSGPMIDELGLSPMQANLIAAQAIGGGLTGQTQTTTLGSGRTINYNPPTPSEGTPMSSHEEVIKNHNDAVKAAHDSRQAQIKARKAQLDAESKAIKAEHLSTGLIPNIGRTLTLRPQDYPYGSWERNYGEGAQNLIGKGKDWLNRTFWTGQ